MHRFRHHALVGTIVEMAVALPDDFCAVMAAARELQLDTGGAFNPAAANDRTV